MTFYERYAKLCGQRGIEPCSQKAADMFNTTRATISTWRKTKAIPRGETVKLIADELGVSTDYLLNRTDDPTDYTNPDLVASFVGPITDHFDGDVQKTATFQKAVAADVKEDVNNTYSRIVDLYGQLDNIDKVRVESYIEGILTGDKYKKKINLA